MYDLLPAQKVYFQQLKSSVHLQKQAHFLPSTSASLLELQLNACSVIDMHALPLLVELYIYTCYSPS